MVPSNLLETARILRALLAFIHEPHNLPRMRQLLTASLLATLSLLFFAGCASTPVIDYDQSALPTMQGYRSYTLDSREQRETYQNLVLSPIVDRRIENAIHQELAENGYVRDDTSPDFRVTFDTATKTKKRVDNLGVGPTPFRRYPYNGYANYSTFIVREYEEGSFIIDIIDQSSKDLMWRGVYIKELGWSAPSTEEVQQIVSKTLGQFPPKP